MKKSGQRRKKMRWSQCKYKKGIPHGTVYQVKVTYKFDSVFFHSKYKEENVMYYMISNVHEIFLSVPKKYNQSLFWMKVMKDLSEVWISKLKLKLLCLLPSICNDKKNLLKHDRSFNRLAREENLAINLSLQSKLSSLITSIQLQTAFNFSIPFWW